MNESMADSLTVEALGDLRASVDSLRGTVAGTRIPDRISVDVASKPPESIWGDAWPVLLGAIAAALFTAVIEGIRHVRADNRMKLKVVLRYGVALSEIDTVADVYVGRATEERFAPTVLSNLIRKCEEAQALAEHLHLLNDDVLAASLEHLVSEARMTAEAAIVNDDRAERYALFVAGHSPPDPGALKLTIDEAKRVRSGTMGQLKTLSERAAPLLARLIGLEKRVTRPWWRKALGLRAASGPPASGPSKPDG